MGLVNRSRQALRRLVACWSHLKKPGGQTDHIDVSKDDRVPVASSPNELREILAASGAQVAVLFFAHRGSKKAWDQSITRVTLNRVDPRFVYVPVEIAPDQLSALYQVALDSKIVYGLNHTTPHKNNTELRALTGTDPSDARMIDFAVRDRNGFRATELNGQSFAQWLATTIGNEELHASQFVIRGGGNTGRSIARYLLDVRQTEAVTIVERNIGTASMLAELLPNAHITNDLESVATRLLPDPIVVEASGATDPEARMQLRTFLRSFTNPGVFVDLRTATHEPETPHALRLGWTAYDGSGMSMANDWQIIEATMTAAGLKPVIGLHEFEQLSRIASSELTKATSATIA
jgi:shikimate 5-dehydrogenase